MKFFLTILFAVNFSVLVFVQNDIIPNNQNTKRDTIKEITTIGIFDGNYIGKTGYKINEYYIALGDLSSNQVDSLKGKRIMVFGKLKIIKGDKESKTIQSKSEDRKYIEEPKYTIVYDSREPLLKK